jgi:dethiobiotin synthetase
VLAAALVAALRADGVDAAAFKPVVTGLDEPEPGRPADHELLAVAAGQSSAEVAPLRFGPPVSPHLAAELAGTSIEPASLLAAARGLRAEVVVAEGVGGLLVPLTLGYSAEGRASGGRVSDPPYTIRDFALDLGWPVIVAARPGLGTINHSLLTVEAARAAGLEVRAVVLTPWPAQPSEMHRSNAEAIRRLGGVEVAALREVGIDVPQLALAGATLPYERWLRGRARP